MEGNDMKFIVLEEKKDYREVGEGYQETDGIIKFNIDDKTYILSRLKEEINNVIVKPKKQKNNNHFENDITKQIPSYNFPFKKEVLKDVSQLLNEHYQNIISRDALHKLIKDILTKYKQDYLTALYGYIKYFEVDGLLVKGKDGIYTINRSNLIPKKEKESGGFLDELGMS